MTKKVKFLQDFQGRETKEVFYKLGQEVELDDHIAELLLVDRRVELVDYPAPQTAEQFLEPVVFKNVTGVESEIDIQKPGGEVKVVEHFDEPLIPEDAGTLEIKPKAKRGRK